MKLTCAGSDKQSGGHSSGDDQWAVKHCVVALIWLKFLRRLPRPDNVVLVDGLRAVWALLSQVDVAE